MQHKVKVTVIDKKCYTDLQKEFCSDPQSGPCPIYQVGDEFIFERYGKADDFWHMGLNTLITSSKNSAGGQIPHCSEAWDAISRYIYTGLQGGSIMRGWMNDERVMIACCSDGTRPVIFKIERLDYKVVYINEPYQQDLKDIIMQINGVNHVEFKDDWIEVFCNHDIEDVVLKQTIEETKQYTVKQID